VSASAVHLTRRRGVFEPPPGGVHRLQLYRQQHEFVMAEQHHLALLGGIGSGKSIAGNVRVLLAALGALPFLPAPNLGVVTAPTYKMLDDATYRSFKQVAGAFLVDYNASKGLARMANGSEIIFRSTQDPDTLRGPSISYWHGDEAALSPAEVWSIMLGRLRQDGRQGYAWLTTTPKGKQWIYKIFAQTFVDDPDYRLIRVKTHANPFVSREWIEALEANYHGEYARQELYGEFVGWEGLIYPEFDRARHTTNTFPTHYEEVIAGVDWGFNNPGVIQVCGVRDGVVYNIHEEYAARRGIDDWARIALQLRHSFGVSAFYCDPSEPAYIEKLREQGCKAHAANNSVLPGIQAIKRRLNSNTLLHYAGAVHTFAEYEAYQWARKGSESTEHPLKSNDHALDALRYAVMGIEHGMRPLAVRVREGLG
jgi:phage terminase large subunit